MQAGSRRRTSPVMVLAGAVILWLVSSVSDARHLLANLLDEAQESPNDAIKSSELQSITTRPNTNPATSELEAVSKTPEVASNSNSSNGNSTEPVPLYMQHMNIVLVTLHLSVFVTGLVGNALVCLSVYRNKSLQTITNYYIVNLAVADFLVILICLPPTVYWDLMLFWSFGLVLCKLVLYLQSISVGVSVLTLTCISIDRWYAICRPLKFSSSKSRAKSTIGLIWLVSALIASPDVIYLTLKPIGEENNYVYMDCTYGLPEMGTRIYQLCLVTLLFVLPFVLMTISYSEIVNVLWRNETMAETMQNSMNQLESETAAAAAAAAVAARAACCQAKQQAPVGKRRPEASRHRAKSSIISIMSKFGRKAYSRAAFVGPEFNGSSLALPNRTPAAQDNRRHDEHHNRDTDNHSNGAEGDIKCDGNCSIQDNEGDRRAPAAAAESLAGGLGTLEMKPVGASQRSHQSPPSPSPSPSPSPFRPGGGLKLAGVIMKRPTVRQQQAAVKAKLSLMTSSTLTTIASTSASASPSPSSLSAPNRIELAADYLGRAERHLASGRAGNQCERPLLSTGAESSLSSMKDLHVNGSVSGRSGGGGQPRGRALSSISLGLGERLRNLGQFLGVTTSSRPGSSDVSSLEASRGNRNKSQIGVSSLVGANYFTRGLSSGGTASEFYCMQAATPTSKRAAPEQASKFAAPNCEQFHHDDDRRRGSSESRDFGRKLIQEELEAAKPTLSDHVASPSSGKFHTITPTRTANSCDDDRHCERLDGREIASAAAAAAAAAAASQRRSSRRAPEAIRRCSDGTTVWNVASQRRAIKTNYSGSQVQPVGHSLDGSLGDEQRGDLVSCLEAGGERGARARADELGHVEGGAIEPMPNGLDGRQSETLSGLDTDNENAVGFAPGLSPVRVAMSWSQGGRRLQRDGHSLESGRRATAPVTDSMRDSCPVCERLGRCQWSSSWSLSSRGGARACSCITANEHERRQPATGCQRRHHDRGRRLRHSRRAARWDSLRVHMEPGDEHQQASEPHCDCMEPSRGPSGEFDRGWDLEHRRGRHSFLSVDECHRAGCGRGSGSLKIATGQRQRPPGSPCGRARHLVSSSNCLLDREQARGLKSSTSWWSTRESCRRPEAAAAAGGNYARDSWRAPRDLATPELVNGSHAGAKVADRQTETDPHVNCLRKRDQERDKSQLGLAPGHLCYHARASTGRELAAPIKLAASSGRRRSEFGASVRQPEAGSRGAAGGRCMDSASDMANRTDGGGGGGVDFNARDEPSEIVASPIQSSGDESASYDHNQTGARPMGAPPSSAFQADSATRPATGCDEPLPSPIVHEQGPNAPDGRQLNLVEAHSRGPPHRKNLDRPERGAAKPLMNLPQPRASSESAPRPDNQLANQGVDGGRVRGQLGARPVGASTRLMEDILQLDAAKRVNSVQAAINHYELDGGENSYQRRELPLACPVGSKSGAPVGLDCGNDGDDHGETAVKRRRAESTLSMMTGANYSAIAITTTTSDGVPNGNQSALVAMASRMRTLKAAAPRSGLGRKLLSKTAVASDYRNRLPTMAQAGGGKRDQRKIKTANNHQMSRLQVRSASSLRSMSATSLASQTGTINNHSSYQHRHYPTTSSTRQYNKLIESRKKAAKMLIVIVIMFGLCYLPVHCLNILRITIQVPQSDLITTASLISHWLCYFNSAVNPLIYNFMSGKFRHEFAQLFFCRFLRRSTGNS